VKLGEVADQADQRGLVLDRARHAVGMDGDVVPGRHCRLFVYQLGET